MGITTLRLPISPALRLGLRTALALVLAYAVALSNDWQRPNWAGFAVVVLSLNTGGESLRKAAMRLGGTIAGAVAALTIIALVPQDRWAFLFGLAAWVAFCAYRMTGSPTPYAWQVAGFVAPIIAIDGGPPNGVNDFLIAVERLLETFTGVLAYSLSCLVIRTGSSREVFHSEMDGLIGQLRNLPNLLLPAAAGEAMAPSFQEVVGGIRRRLSRFQALLPPAMSESTAIRNAGPRWRAALARLPVLLDTLERLGLLIACLPAPERWWLRPLLARVRGAMDRSFLGLRQLLEMTATIPASPDIPELDPAALRSELDALPLPIRVTAALCLQQIETLIQLTESIQADTLGTSAGAAAPGRTTPRQTLPFLLPDPHRLASALWTGMTIVVAGLVWMYLPDSPGGSGLIAITGSLALALVATPGANARMLLKPTMLALAITAPIYILIMPRVPGYTGLALVIAMVGLLYSVVFYSKPVTRLMGLILFLTATSITNLQRYSFIALIDIGLLFCLVVVILTLMQEIPFSSRPEQQFHRLLCDFSRSLEVAALPRAQQSPLEQVRFVLHRRRLISLPARLTSIAARIPQNLLGGTAPTISTLMAEIVSLMLWLQLWWELDPPTSLDPVSHSTTPHLRHVLAPLSNLGALVHQEERETLQSLAGSSTDQSVSADESWRLELWAGCCRRVGEKLQALEDLGETMEWQTWHQPRFA